MGSRRDIHTPPNFRSEQRPPPKENSGDMLTRLPAKFPGTWISADYHLINPSTGFDILADVEALFEYLLSLPIDHHQLFFAGFSGGGYPMRLAATIAAKESQKPKPRYTVLGCLSFCGMAGDHLLDYWVFPHANGDVTADKIEAEVPKRKALNDKWKTLEEVSDWVVSESHGDLPERGWVWEYWHLGGAINDAMTGDEGLSEKLRALPYDQRLAAIPEKYIPLVPQALFEKNGSICPPFLLLHGDKDNVIPYEESLNTLKALKESGGDVELVTVAGTDHSMRQEGLKEDEPTKEDGYALKWILERSRAAQK